MNIMKKAVVGLALTIAGIALAGCSVGFTPDGDQEPTIQEPDAGGASTADGAASGDGAEAGASDDQASTDEGEPTAPDATASGIWDRFAGNTTTVTCPDGALTIDAPSSIVHVTGACADLTVTGAGSVVLADSVDTLTVSAVSAMVAVDSVAHIIATEDSVSALVEWSQGQPSIVDDGTLTVVNQVVR